MLARRAGRGKKTGSKQMLRSIAGYLVGALVLAALAQPAASMDWHVYGAGQLQPVNFAGLFAFAGQSVRAAARPRSSLDELIAHHAAVNAVPESLVRRVIARESGGNPRAVSAGNYGLMQIRLGTARAMGYGGSAEGLLDAATNMTYAVRYLAGAYLAAGRNEGGAIALYQRGY
jgi:soluble lytic murein transglycosylase-like protein